MQKIKIFIADSNTLTREGLKSIILKREDFEIIGEATENITLKKALKKLPINLLIIDFLAVNFRLEDVFYTRKYYPNLPILVITHYPNNVEVIPIIDLGIKSYLLKECEEDEIMHAINSLLRNEKFFCPKILDIILENHQNSRKEKKKHLLSQREIEIVKLFTKGYSAKEIASHLFLSHHTINTHRKNILKKLKLNSTTELILFGIENGLNSTNDSN